MSWDEYVKSLQGKRKPSLTFTGRKHSQESKDKIAAAHRNKHREPFSNEWRKRMSESHIGLHPSSEAVIAQHNGLLGNTHWLGRKHTEETKIKMRESRSKLVIPFRDTGIEKIVQSHLNSLGMLKGTDYVTHKSFKIGNRFHQVDLYVFSCELPIECDGIYWHSLPGAKERDRVIDKGLFEQYGLQVLRLSENCIQNGDFKCMVNERLSTKDLVPNIVQ